MVTITGGKLTTWRRMAKMTVDRIVEREGREAPCRTHEIPLGQPIDAEQMPHVDGVDEADLRAARRPLRLRRARGAPAGRGAARAARGRSSRASPTCWPRWCSPRATSRRARSATCCCAARGSGCSTRARSARPTPRRRARSRACWATSSAGTTRASTARSPPGTSWRPPRASTCRGSRRPPLVELELLHPERRPVDGRRQLSDLRLAERAPDDRPYVVLNMVASIDGRTTLGGHVGALTGAGRPARRSTAAHAGGRAARRRGHRAQRALRRARAADGLGPQPLVVIVSGRGRPAARPAAAPGAGHADPDRDADATPSSASTTCAQVEYLRMPGRGRPRRPRGAVPRAARRLRRAVGRLRGRAVAERGAARRRRRRRAVPVARADAGRRRRAHAGRRRAGARRRGAARLLSVATADDYLFLRYAL